jgi:hypothetical protein
MQRIPSDAEWTRGRVATLPKRWSDRLLRQWRASQATDYYKANVDLRETTEALLRVRISLDASDVDICEAADIRSDLHRRGIGVYGFRIAEPQHDGTPHWHFLLFFDEEHAQPAERGFLTHALKDSPDEPGAREHRCYFERIDWSKGSAAGYVAKYVSKNIDGEHVGEDLNGGAATKTAVRVEAWAARWGIRQFQFVGGPPVGIWRELRRIESVPAQAPQHLRDAHDAAYKRNAVEGHASASVAWDKYCEAQGGVFCGRDARIKLAMATPERVGRYGDEPAPRPFGVETSSIDDYEVPESLGMRAHRLVHWVVESARHVWEILRKPPNAPLGSSFAERAQPEEPWTRVNNCTTKSPLGTCSAHPLRFDSIPLAKEASSKLYLDSQ